MKSNKNYVTENINLKQQVIDLKVANKDKAETIKSMKQELLEYSELRERFKVLYKENEKLKNAIDILKDKLCVRKGTLSFTRDNYYLGVKGSFKDIKELTQQEYNLLKEVLE